MTFIFSKSKNSGRLGQYDSSKNYDCLLIPTGETSFGDRSFPVSSEAARLFESGKFGCIFVTGGYNGFANGGPGKKISEAYHTVAFLKSEGIPKDKIYSDNRSLESVGNFTFPLFKPLYQNTGLDEFDSMLIVAKEGHMWRLKDYSKLVLPHKIDVDFHEVPGKHNNGLLARLHISPYHVSLMNALKGKVGVEEIHNFLMEEHPFYRENWYGTPVFERKVEMSSAILKWSMK
jgi:uncharacterized SAM-binding protein YcdF (DUF218 family)